MKERRPRVRGECHVHIRMHLRTLFWSEVGVHASLVSLISTGDGFLYLFFFSHASDAAEKVK